MAELKASEEEGQLSKKEDHLGADHSTGPLPTAVGGGTCGMGRTGVDPKREQAVIVSEHEVIGEVVEPVAEDGEWTLESATRWMEETKPVQCEPWDHDAELLELKERKEVKQQLGYVPRPRSSGPKRLAHQEDSLSDCD